VGKFFSIFLITSIFQVAIYAQSIHTKQCENLQKIIQESNTLYKDFNDSENAKVLLQNSKFGRILYSKPECLDTNKYIEYLNKYCFYLSLDTHRQNTRFIEKFIEKYPQNAKAYLYLGNIYKNISQKPRMVQYREKAINMYESYVALCKKQKKQIEQNVLEFLKNGGLQKTKETWGKYLNPENSIPTNKFKAFYINTTAPKNIIASEIVDMISVNYPYKKFHNIDSKDFGAYWVGNFTFAKDTKMQMNISQSWAKTRIIIDNLIVYEGRGNAEIPFNFKRGTHKIEVEYINNWHTTKFSIVIMPFQKLYTFDELKKLRQKHVINIWYIGIHESRKKDHSVDISLKKSDKQLVLLLQSYQTTIWNIHNPFKNKIDAIIIGRSKPGSKVVADVAKKSIYYANFSFGSDDLYPECSCHSGHFHCEGGSIVNTNRRLFPLFNQKIDGFSGKYGVKDILVPNTVLDDKKYKEIHQKIENIQEQRQKCLEKTNQDFNQIFK
jgi:tetratricopeptide (TPR) repeat protein